MSAGEERLRVSLMRVLGHEATRRINFNCCGLNISFEWFDTVHRALLNRQIGTGLDPRLKPNQAFYDDKTKSFYFNRYNFGDLDSVIAEKALCLHESVHAMIDVNRISISTARSEVVAYVAQELFTIYAGYSSRDLIALYDNANEMRNVFQQVDLIVSKLSEKPGASVSFDDAGKVEQELRKIGLYQREFKKREFIATVPSYDDDD